jgi:hypothetical protein
MSLGRQCMGGDVAVLTCDLQEGFDDDTVAIYIHGKRVFRQRHVTTMRMLGLARSFQIEAKEGFAILMILVETRELLWTDQLAVSDDVHLGISIVAGTLDVFRSDKALGYA